MSFDLTSSIAVLERTPFTLRAMLTGLPTEWLHATEGPQTWSPFDIVGHLVVAERTNWISRAQVILNQGDNSAFPPFDRLAHFRESAGRLLTELVDDLERLRIGNLETLCSWQLTNDQLDLAGQHPEFGPVTLRQLLAAWVVHDLGHVAQIARVMAKRHRETIGPYRAYLPIVDR